MPTRDLSSPLDDDNLFYILKSEKFPDGKTYLVPAPDGVDGLAYLRLWSVAENASNGVKLTEDDQRQLQLDGDDEAAFLIKILSKDTFDEMIADGVKWAKIKEAVEDAFAIFAQNEEVADLIRAARLAGKAPAPNRAQRRAAAKKPSGAKPTAKKTAGSKSSRASSGTPARTTAPASTPSLKSTQTDQPPQAAAS